ncbi:MAG: sel1 repeat family protein [Akkermansiaceae bacterium]|nr:sel1 repeat family protein [Akkermansiaceae bacterium]
MRLKKSALLFSCSLLALTAARAAVSSPIEISPEIAKEAADAAVPDASGPAKPALDAFKAGEHDKAVALAGPLAATGNADALYLLGFAHESGQGADVSRDKAVEFYTKAVAAGQKDAVYRLSFIYLASEKEEERSKARELLETAAKTDPTVAGRVLGEAWMRGRLSKEPDFDKALQWWNSAAEKGDITSLMLIARLYEGQFGFPDKQDGTKSLEAYKKAAEKGEPVAMSSLGSRLLNGPEKFRNEKEGREWLRKAADAKEYSAYLALGDYEENVKKDLNAALAAYEKGKDAGQQECAIRAAEFYIEGKGIEKDIARGTTVLEAAAKDGSAQAHLRLAVLAFGAEKPDRNKGYGHLAAAASGGVVEAQNELGLFYLSGKLGGMDASAAAAWFTRAAQAGYAPSQNNLATLFERGAGVQQSLQNAGQLYALAAQQGHGPATLALARLHAQGAGIKRDLGKAWAFASLASGRGEKEAETFAKEIDAKLDDTQRAEAKKFLAEMNSAQASAPVAPAPPVEPAKPVAPTKPAPKK